MRTKEKKVEKVVQIEVKGVLVAGTQAERYTYTSILAQIKKVSYEGENTERMEMDTPPPRTNK